MTVFERQDFALFGNLDLSVNGSWRLRNDGAISRPSSAPDGSTTTVEKSARHIVFYGEAGDIFLC